MRKHTSNGVENRRRRALYGLQRQLKSGQKPLESARLQSGERVMQELEPADIKRIEKEIGILQSRLKPSLLQKIK